jgi:hypothetical protein
MTAATYSVEDPFILITKKRPAADEDDQREARSISAARAAQSVSVSGRFKSLNMMMRAPVQEFQSFAADIAIKAALIPEDTFFLQALVDHRLPFARRLMFKWRPAVSANGRCA